MDIIISCRRVKVNRNRVKQVVRKILENIGCPDNAEIGIIFTDNEIIRELNKRYLKKDRPTDVLSFPIFNPKISDLKLFPFKLIGDVIISVEKAEWQAKSMNISLDEEIRRLLMHGILHLFGYEHENDRKKALQMKRKEEIMLRKLDNI